MTIIEAGIIAGMTAGVTIGGRIGMSHGLWAGICEAAIGGIAGLAVGGVYAFVLICLIAVISIVWRSVRRRASAALTESDIKFMSPTAIRGTFISALIGVILFMNSGWVVPLFVLIALMLLTAFVAVVRCELRQRSNAL